MRQLDPSRRQLLRIAGGGMYAASFTFAQDKLPTAAQLIERIQKNVGVP